ncbi:hypothetical protein D9611_014025 [Ephemerocybe angulata]|uniref:Dynactin subunit 4 n=1 Tax=Ephemerocybe angulata TaxID=980116 RepID=A0A8H5AQW4_9AGAR|nr:hypothetical protein D9611_014025 [Tulosesus angulatus]
MAPSVLYHCPCLSTSSVPPPPHLPSSSYSFHPLNTLFFCEECDAVRCNQCVSVEVSSYYCPNCLFEVPSASVRAEKNRCARNCFMCPNCRNTLAAVPADPPESSDGRISGSVNEGPYILYCNHCRWDSVEIGITFEKPTGLAAQLQKFEDSAPDSLEFDRLKEHFDAFLRQSALAASTTAAASAALARDIPGVGKYNPLARSTNNRGYGKDKSVNRDEMTEYRSRSEISQAAGGGELDVELMNGLEEVDEVASLDQRWESSWVSSMQTKDLKPIRIPLHSKRSKRCPACTHILIKPEQKSQSVRYKIKLVASNYLPGIVVVLPHVRQAKEELLKRNLGKSVSAQAEEPSVGMVAGRSYEFQLNLTNPLYDPIEVRLSVQRVHVSTAPAKEGVSPEKAKRPPFAISLPTTKFPISPFAEAWEYEDDEDMFGVEDDELGIGPTSATVKTTKDKDGRARPKTVGVLERKANKTVVGGEIVIGKEAQGSVKFNMLVSYTYRSDDPAPSESGDMDGHNARAPEIKTFSFYTVVDLGPIIPREEVKLDL